MSVQRYILAISGILIICFGIASAQIDSSATTILFDRGSYDFDFTDLNEVKWRFQRHYQLVIREAVDIEILKNISLETNTEEKEELQGAKVKVLSPSNVDREFSLDSFAQQPFDADWTDYLLTIEELQIGDTLDISYTILSEPRLKIYRWDFQYAYPVLRSELQLLVPEAITFVDKLSDVSYLKSETALDTIISIARAKAQLKGVRVVCENIPGYREEPLAPYLVETRPAYLVSLTNLYPLADSYLPPWSDQITDLVLNDWWGKQYRNRGNFRWLLAAADDLLDKKYDDQIKISLLYQFVHEQATWDGTYGLFPSATMDEMVIEKNVNRASMNMLLLALLREDGFKAYPILVSTIDMPPVQQEVPDINQFNHFVIAVDDGKNAVYLDAGDPSLPVGTIDPMVRRNMGVLIRNYKGNWVSLPEGEGKSTILVDVTLASDLSGSGYIKASFEGYDAMSERLQLAADPTGQYWKDRAAELSSFLRIDSVRYSNVKNPLSPFENVVHFHLITPGVDSMWINPVFYSFFNQAYFTDSIRTTPVVFPFKMFENIIMNIHLPEDVKVVYRPEPQRIKLEGQPFVLEHFVDESQNTQQIRSNLRLDKTRFEVGEYGALSTFLSHILEALGDGILLAKG